MTMSETCPASRQMRSHTSSMKSLSRSNVDLSAPPRTAEDSLTVTPVLPSLDTTAFSPDHTTVKQEPDMKQEGDASPSQSPTLVDDIAQIFKTPSSPTPPPTTSNGTSSKSSTPPAVAPSKASRKAAPLPIQLIGDLPIAREDALSTFNQIHDNNYQFKSLGRSREMLESMTCDCTYEPGVDKVEDPCGPYSDCINRLTQVECLEDDCRCRSYCQNQRFQRKEYANIEIVLTEKKGYGLRAEADLPRDSFIYEYVGDVVNPTSFKKRMRDYAEEGIRHFYFMMLQKDEFIDATKSGGIGRFANHSCNPNCYVAKWTIGNHVRMGIFAKRNIQAHEELTFNYNVDRYGHQAQECFCGEPMCVGYIGGKTQTDIATMDDLYLDALGITDEDDVTELKGTKKKKGKKIDDADFMPTMKPITEKEVPKVVQAIRQTTSRKVLIKLLTRIKITEDASALRQIMRLRGYSLMTNVLEDYESDLEMITISLECMTKWPLLNRNKVQDSKVFVPVEKCAALEDEAIKTLAQSLLDHWETLPVYNRIPKRVLKIDPDEAHTTLPSTSSNLAQQVKAQNDWTSFSEPSRKRRAVEDYQPRDFWYGQTTLDPPRPRPKPVEPMPVEEWIKTPAGKAHQAAIKQKETERKEKEEALKAIIASATAAAAAEDAAAASAAAEAKAKAEAAAAKEARRRERASRPKDTPKDTPEEKEARKEKKLTKLIGPVVVKCMSKHSKAFDRDDFKKHAKELTQIITEKEKKSSSYRDNKLDSLSEEKVVKIKKFAKEYIAKVIRKMEKSGKHPSKAGSSASASIVRDTPTSSTAQQTPNSNDGDNAQYTSLSVEDAMQINFDSDVESDLDEDVVMADGQPYRAPPPNISHSDSRTHKLGHDSMLVDDDLPHFIPEDPRRRPLMDR
ncbi:hypothetical protein D9619_011795 [Psilocybe cf. subviscida]|uniref:Histone-lysine N-methyltransferase, H3 lysine-36 specific n=1 Tax=Psilocybe cf. subviscida TaxID=2480587 RepID=A0A8H5B143_9AGAR|nr:hypothetical protein D9619_011795 [Psilocybe cf. subviscida]